ncbi:uncharacterized protein LOC117300350 [Asterias rubens]|uniref:uncharacterized protein LOC117300350 n=1 Tax=Asterias rubens TaxID=7604 RepID=UPI0014557C54|nr:uncharacterized protein LOC117300350 [Asterias rubens]
MGNQHSQQYGQAGGITQQGVRVGAHSNIPNDAVPYQGPRHQYCFINVEATLSTQASFLSAAIISTNIDAYYPIICQPYADGFILKQFQSIPGVQRQKGFGFSMAMPFQAILCKPLTAPSHERWQLRVEKSFLQTQQVLQFFSSSSTSVADTSDIFQKINSVTAQGGRLICIEITGHERGPSFGQSFSGYQGLKGVDLFFNMPLHPNPTIYVYQAVSVPIQFQLMGGFGQTQIRVLTDFMGQFSAYLQKGWKLVEVNFDTSQTTQAGFFQARSSMNSIWFFEKEASKINSQVPEWEGTIIEYEHKVSASFGGTRAKTNWDPIMIDMGQRGWEIACLVESPEVYQTGFTSSGMKVLMFFQRRIIRPSGAGGFVAPQGGHVPQPSGYHQPTGAHPPPTSGYPQPTGGYPQPTGVHPPPTSGYPQPTSGYPQPTSGYPQPTSGYPQPTSGYPQPTSGYPQPTSGYPQPTSGYPQPAGCPPPSYPGYPHQAPQGVPAPKK